MTASASARTLDAGRPTNDEPSATIASADARSTDGSKRVIVANSSTIAIAATVRGPSASRRSSGPNSASVNATFSPDTASRCERPESRYAGDDVVGNRAGVAEQEAGEQRAWRRRQRRGAAQHDVAERRWRRRSAAACRREREHLDPVEAARPRAASARAVEARRVQRPSRPRSTTRSPASSTRSRSASSPVATANNVRCEPPAGTRTYASVSKRPLCGSSTSTPENVTGAPRAIAAVSGECT